MNTPQTNLLALLVCPLCKGKLFYRQEENELVCRSDALAFPVRDQVPVMLEGEARHCTPQELEALK